jgi:hypothetical protein
VLNIKKIFRTKSYTSAQLVAKCYADAGIKLFEEERPFGNVAPGDILRILSSKRLLATKTRPLVKTN